MKIMLSKENLTDLMKGEVLDFVSIDGKNYHKVLIALSDIGFDEMRFALVEAEVATFNKSWGEEKYEHKKDNT